MICSISEHLGTCSSLNHEGKKGKSCLQESEWPDIDERFLEGGGCWGDSTDRELYLKKKMACRN